MSDFMTMAASHAKEHILEDLQNLPESNVQMFRRIFDHHNVHSTIEDVVFSLEDEKLKNAYDLVQRTIQARKRKTK